MAIKFARTVGSVPSVHRKKRPFDLSHRVSTTMKVGYLTPIDIVEVLPNDTWDFSVDSLTRLSAPLVRPIMDDVFLDTATFFVPLRILQSNLENVFGDPSPSAYSAPNLAEIAHLTISSPGDPISVAPGSVADYLGIPSSLSADYEDLEVSVLPFRAFAFVSNEYYRNEATMNETLVNLGSTPGANEVFNVEPWSETNYFGMLPHVPRYKDYFSTAVVAPQKGPAVRIPGINNAPVRTTDDGSLMASGLQPSLRLMLSTGAQAPSSVYLRTSSGTAASPKVLYGSTISGITSTDVGFIVPRNLVVQGTDDGTINSLRLAFQMQKYLERSSIYGSRYQEYTYSAYGITPPDAHIQIPEFLSGSHNRLSISQTAATSTSDQSTYDVGQFAGNIQSLSDKSGHFRKTFREHGYLITVACIRYKHLYSQALPRLWTRFTREQFYDPLFANLSQQALYVSEIYAPAYDSELSASVLGYQAPFADYRTIFDRVSGQMRPDSGNLGQYWSLADRFDGSPTLLDVTVESTGSFSRVLQVSDTVQDPFVVDFAFKCIASRVVDPYGIPGYADHH